MFLLGPLSIPFLFVSTKSSYLRTRTSSSLNIVSTEHAKEVFHLIDTDNSGLICSDELSSVLGRLDIHASEEEVSALAKYLDVNGDGDICEEDFLTWYQESASTVASETNAVRQALLQRRTVNDFDKTPVPDLVLRNAIEAAIHAPNHKMTEPWRFIKLGPETISKIAELNASEISKKDPEKGAKKKARWEAIPGWCVVTCQKSEDEVQQEEDLAAVACAIQNFQLSMFADGVGVKWTSGPITRTTEFAELCGIDINKEKFVGCMWYGFATGGFGQVNRPTRKKSIDDVLSSMP